MMYSSVFQELYYLADHVYEGRLPIHVHCVMDEFANGATRSQLKRLGVKPKNIMKIERSFEHAMVS
jgi:type IV secretion system protein VirD4